MAALVSAGVVESGGTVRFTHPILRAAIYGDLSPAERERLHHAAATILRERGAPAGQVAAQVMHTEPAADPEAVALLRDAARDALALGDAAGAAALLSRALDEPPADGDRAAVAARARPGARPRRRTGGDRPAVGDRRARRGRGRDRRGGDRAQRHALLRRPRRRRSGDPAPRPGAAPGRGAGTRAARGRAARPQLHLGVGPARGRRDDRRPARSGRPGTRRAAGHHARHARDGRGAVPALGVHRDRPRGARDRGGPPARAPPRRELGDPGPGRPRGRRRSRRRPAGRGRDPRAGARSGARH